MKVVMFGIPTAGKGTQSKLIAKEYGLQHISTGDIFRKHMENKTPLGLEIDSIMRDGRLVSDTLTNSVIKEELEINKNWVLDGYPRNIHQAILFEKYIEKYGYDITYVYLHLPENEAWVRSRNRRELEHRPEDATDEIIQKRFNVFNNTTLQAIKHFESFTSFFKIDATQSIEKVYSDIKHILNT